jgi:multiple sugar transport system permease protein
LRQFKQQLSDKYDGDISKLNKDMGTRFKQWREITLSTNNLLLRRSSISYDPFNQAILKFMSEQPQHNRYYLSVEGYYKAIFLKVVYTRKIKQYNLDHDTDYKSYDQIHLTRRAPQEPSRQRDDWEEFVRTLINVLWLRVDESATKAYHDFLRAKYVTIDILNNNYNKQWVDFSEIAVVRESPKDGMARSDWAAFIEGWKDPETGKIFQAPLNSMYIHSVDLMYRDHLQKQYKTIDKLNHAAGTAYTSFNEVMMPQRAYHYLAFKEITGELRWEFVKRNYLSVIDFIILKGRGMRNTVIYCTLAVLAALLVNPLAAYAMSRYRMPSSYKILLFLMMTMAFPAMVTSIPAFLMMRQFGMLNTFAALVLPGLANGYAIFLLKGFFDSLPRELYECAELDGANEFVMFWQITMTLSKPILAVIALGAFTAAYSNFLFALLLCQDEDMWTLMPWLFQLQYSSGPGIVFASLIIAAIPTFVIFALCQNIIMRGIVVPVEK